MLLLSTSGQSPPVPLAEALRRGPAPDGGLYLPEEIEPLSTEFFDHLAGRSLVETSRRLARHLFGTEIEPRVLDRIVSDALDFPIPLVRVGERIRVLELFHGPTLAFKDVGARFLARLLTQTRKDQRTLSVLVATSGDTGGAVAQAFFGVEGTRVAVLYPRGLVTPVQECQFTTLGGNIRALAVNGTFDDCQRLVKGAFADRALAEQLNLTSANSINVGRLLPQIFYYFHAVSQLGAEDAGRPVLFSTPSGNFGNLTAGLIAKRLGLACRFVAATNANDVVPAFLASGVYEPRASLRTLSNAMDVGDPSNMARIRYLYGDDVARLRDDVVGRWVDDQTTQATIRQVDRDLGYLCDPHTAVGYRALADVLAQRPESTIGIVLSTAHPAKFREVVEPVVERTVPLPRELGERLERPMLSEELANEQEELRRRLLAW